MTEFRATVAIVRRHIDRRFAIDWLVQFALVAIIVAVFGKILRGEALAIAIAASLAAASAAERSHARALRRITFFAMPLYGRQLARAHAVAPLIMATSIPLGFEAAAFARHTELGSVFLIVLTLSTFVATLVSISSVFRDGINAAYYGVGGALCGVAVAVPFFVDGRYNFNDPLPVTIVLSAIAGFFALRAFGETLARYDPIGD